jgi:hypothetical protein
LNGGRGSARSMKRFWDPWLPSDEESDGGSGGKSASDGAEGGRRVSVILAVRRSSIPTTWGIKRQYEE